MRPLSDLDRNLAVTLPGAVTGCAAASKASGSGAQQAFLQAPGKTVQTQPSSAAVGSPRAWEEAGAPLGRHQDFYKTVTGDKGRQ